VEYAYSLMAQAAGVEMSECRLLAEHDRRHFMTRRFDRPDEGGKLHMQTVGGLEHSSYNEPGSYSYEQALLLVRQMGLDTPAVEQLFRRMVFNVVARNQDDHVKNIAFLMDKRGRWSLSPAFDMTYAYQPQGRWTSRHQMSINGKRDDFTGDDFDRCATTVSMKRGRAAAILGEVREAVSSWPSFAAEADVPSKVARKIANTHRLELPSR